MIHEPSAITLSPLDRADGSASYSSNGYTVIGGVNGPVEVQRRDELPEEAAIEVNIRPVAGVGGIRERHLESIIHSALRQVILTAAHPRTLVQVTLQVVTSQENGSNIAGLPQGASVGDDWNQNIDVLPALLQTAMLALLSTSIPLAKALVSVLLAIDRTGTLLPDPTAQDLAAASSVHVLAFSSLGKLLVVESEGEFSMKDWEEVHEKAKEICLGKEGGGDGQDVSMHGLENGSLKDMLCGVVQQKAAEEQRWKANLG